MAANFVSITPENIKWDLAWKASWGAGSTPLAVLDGDPTAPGIYVVRVHYPPHVFTRPHWHGEDRYIVVLKGTWYFGYGQKFDEKALKPLPPGSSYTEPPNTAHFARTREEVVLQIVGYGPTSTTYVNPADDPTKK